jgi:3-oxoacyl-(acyl-carrier-protein) synthase
VKNLVEKGYKKISPFFIPYAITNMGGALLAIDTGFMGPNYSISTACATANYAYVAAANHIRNGDADVMVVGGSEAPIIPVGLGGFVACRALSTRNDEPQKASRCVWCGLTHSVGYFLLVKGDAGGRHVLAGVMCPGLQPCCWARHAHVFCCHVLMCTSACCSCRVPRRPWDVDRDGFVMGEGAGVFVFESLEHAQKRGANIIAEYLGGAVTCDAHHMTGMCAH